MTSQALFLDFPEIALDNCPQNSQKRVKQFLKSHVKDWEFDFSPDSMQKLVDDGIDAQFLNPANLQEQVRSIQQSLNSQNQVCSESFKT